MYTGVVTESGTVVSTSLADEGRRITVQTDFETPLEPGDSVAVDGVCLTAEGVDGDEFTAFASAETRSRTRLDELVVDDRVNLERPLATTDRVHGHFVKGSVDATTEVLARRDEGEGWTYEFAVPARYEAHITEKGSVAVDGVSLTVSAVEEGRFAVAVIPETAGRTTLGDRRPGDRVNLETDVLAKYAVRAAAVN